MMNAEEKAWDLMERYINLLLDVGLYRDDVKNNALRCADTAVDEILNDNPNIYDSDRLNHKYWKEVKAQLDLL